MKDGSVKNCEIGQYSTSSSISSGNKSWIEKKKKIRFVWAVWQVKKTVGSWQRYSLY